MSADRQEDSIKDAATDMERQGDEMEQHLDKLDEHVDEAKATAAERQDSPEQRSGGGLGV